MENRKGGVMKYILLLSIFFSLNAYSHSNCVTKAEFDAFLLQTAVRLKAEIQHREAQDTFRESITKKVIDNSNTITRISKIVK